MNVCIIPARGGSKRIPRKNIKLFNGKPMIAYAIEAAKRSGLFERIVVTTDDSEISQIAKAFGSETPFVRPRELADDHTPTIAVIAHAINACEALGWTLNNVCCIYPSVPFIQQADLESALQLLQKSSDAYFSFPITEFPSAIQRALRLDRFGKTISFYPENENLRSQDLEAAYHDAGQFYWGSRDAWLQSLCIHNHGVGLVIPNWRVVDIDTPFDWVRAEIMFRTLSLFVASP